MNLYKITIFFPDNVTQTLIASRLDFKDNVLTISALGIFSMLGMYDSYAEAPKIIKIFGVPFRAIEITPSEFEKMKEI